MFLKRNYPAINVWDNGYRPVNKVSNTEMMGRLRIYKINIAYFVRNPQTIYLSEAYRELNELEDEVDGIIGDISNKGTTPTQTIILRGQGVSGQAVLRRKDIKPYLCARIAEYEAEVMEY